LIYLAAEVLNLIGCANIDLFSCESIEFDWLRECSVLVYIPVICTSIYNAQSFKPLTQPGIRKSSRFYSTELKGPLGFCIHSFIVITAQKTTVL